MGQRLMQLNNTFTVADNGQITLHVAQPPPNPNLMQPGPVFMYVVIHGIPSNGTRAIVGNGQIGGQPTADVSVLPSSVLSSNNAAGSASPAGSNVNGGSSSHKKPSTGLITAVAVGGVAIVAIVAAVASVLIARKRRAAAARNTIIGGIARSTSMGRGYRDAKESSDVSAGFQAYDHQSDRSGDGFIPLHQYSQADLHAPSWTPSQTNLHEGPVGGYDGGYPNASQGSMSSFNPYDQGEGRAHPRYL